MTQQDSADVRGRKIFKFTQCVINRVRELVLPFFNLCPVSYLQTMLKRKKKLTLENKIRGRKEEGRKGKNEAVGKEGGRGGAGGGGEKE